MNPASPVATTPLQSVAFAAITAPRTKAVLSLSVPKRRMRHTFATLAGNPKGGPRYAASGEWRPGNNPGYIPPQDEELRFVYNYSRVMAAVASVGIDLESVVGDTTILRVSREAESEAFADGRLSMFARHHDAPEYAAHVARAAAWLCGIREARHEREQSQRFGGRVESLTYLSAYYGPPQWQVRSLASVAVKRWLPAVQNIISRLPAGEQHAAAHEAQQRLGEHIDRLGKLHSMCRKPRDEYKRWESGFGAVDQAIIESTAMIGYAKELAGRMVDDGTPHGQLTGPLRTCVGAALETAVEALDRLAVSRFEVMKVDAWCYRKADMVAFAHDTGGISPGLEVLYHSRGSKFTGC